MVSWVVSFQLSPVAQSCRTLCDPMGCGRPGLPVHHQFPSLLRLMSIESVMPSSHLIVCRQYLTLYVCFLPSSLIWKSMEQPGWGCRDPVNRSLLCRAELQCEFQSLCTSSCISNPAWSWGPPSAGLFLGLHTTTALLFWHTPPPKTWTASEGLKIFFLFT